MYVWFFNVSLFLLFFDFFLIQKAFCTNSFVDASYLEDMHIVVQDLFLAVSRKMHIKVVV